MVAYRRDAELETHARIERDGATSRRAFLGGAAAVAAAASMLRDDNAFARSSGDLAARPPAGFVPLSAPGQVVKVGKAG